MEASVRELEKIAFERGLVEDQTAMAEGSVLKLSFEDGIEVECNRGSDKLCSPPRILIIDDDADFRGMLKQMLQMAGYDVVDAPDGNEGLRLQFSNPFDLIISDVIMPEKEGIETVMEIRKNFPGVKIIMISGGGWYGTDIDFDMARKLGAITLEKPFTRDEIISVIEDLLKNA